MDDNLDFEGTPKLAGLFIALSSRSPMPGKRSIQLFDPRPLDDDLLEELTDELSRPEVGDLLRPHQIIAIVQTAGRGAAGERLRERMRRIIDRRWNEVGVELLRHALASGYRRDALFEALPRLVRSPEFHDVIMEFDASSLSGVDRNLAVNDMSPPTIEQLRRVLPELRDEQTSGLQAHLLSAAARVAGWTPWLRLFGILQHARGLAAPLATEYPPEARSYEAEASSKARREVWAALHADLGIRRLAALITDLHGPLADSPADARSVFVGRLRREIGEDADLRRAVIEALIWEGERQGRDAAIFAAIHLVQPMDLPMLEELVDHPQRHVPYAALTVREAVTGQRAIADAAAPGVAAALAHARTGGRAAASRTWIGNPVLEDMIRATVAGLEGQFAADYERHHRSGEERLGERFFAVLGDRLQMLETGLLRTAQAMQSSRAASVRVQYRPVDKPEEGGPGILRPGRMGDPPKFAADFCLIVDAYLDGRQFARRASLVQAKRLYLKDNARPDLGWKHSFDLKPDQTRALLDQTSSSFYLFQGPPAAGRGLPVVPVHLVEDLAQQQQASGTVIAADTVTMASESFAEWFTDQVIGLRTGDPLAELLAKARGGPGSAPYPLVRFGVMEVEVRVDEPEKPDG